MPQKPVIFISYSHADEAEKEQVLTHLRVLEDKYDIWVDDNIPGGGKWEQEIENAMKKAQMGVMLVSANFLTSGFIKRKEIPTLLRRCEKEGMRIYPIVIKYCAWDEVEWLSEFNVRPQNAVPVFRSSGKFADKELAKIAKEIRKLLDNEKKKGDESVVPFTNRVQEIEKLVYPEDRGTLYFAVDAPTEYGKSRLLEKVIEKYREKKWVYSYVQVKENSSLEELVQGLCDNTQLEGSYLKSDLVSSESLGAQLGGGLVQELDKYNVNTGVVLIVDFDEKPKEKQIYDFFNRVVPDIENSLKRLRARKNGNLKFYVIVAGRYILQLLRKDTKNISPVPLSPFKLKDISASAQNYFGEGIDKTEIDLLSRLSLCLGAGHPGCVSYIFKHRKRYSAEEIHEYVKKYSNDIWSEKVSTYADDIYKNMHQVVPNDDVLAFLSLFRYLDARLLNNIVHKFKYSPFPDYNGVDLGDALTGTYLFQRKNELIQDSIIRRILALRFFVLRPYKFENFCVDAQELCLKRMRFPLGKPHIWFIEYLFLSLQEYMYYSLMFHNDLSSFLAPKEIRLSQNADKRYEHFLETKVKTAVTALNQYYKENDSLGELDEIDGKRGLLERLESEEQWEFRFAVNYHFYQDDLSSLPFEDFLKDIEKMILGEEGKYASSN